MRNRLSLSPGRLGWTGFLARPSGHVEGLLEEALLRPVLGLGQLLLVLGCALSLGYVAYGAGEYLLGDKDRRCKAKLRFQVLGGAAGICVLLGFHLLVRAVAWLM